MKTVKGVSDVVRVRDRKEYMRQWWLKRKRVGQGYPEGKRQFSGVPCSEPRMNWAELRQAKLQCEQCPAFNHWTGGCHLGLLPGCCIEGETLERE